MTVVLARAEAPPRSRRARMPLTARLWRRLIGLGIRLFFAWNRFVCRARLPWGGKLRHVDHITFPCDDLVVAEEFYVGFPGAKLVLRIDQRLLMRMGWAAEDIERNRAPNLSVTFGGGPRLEFFDYPMGRQAEAAECIRMSHSWSRRATFCRGRSASKIVGLSWRGRLRRVPLGRPRSTSTIRSVTAFLHQCF